MVPAAAPAELAALAGQVLCAAVGHPSALGVEIGQSVPEEVFDHHVDEIAAQVAHHQVGAVCWFPSRPEGDRPEQVSAWIQRLQDAAPHRLLMGTDQEGGRVARMRQGFFVPPSARSYAGDLERIHHDAQRSGAALREVGFNTVFAPVADVDSNPNNPVIADRSYSSDPAEVAACVTAALAGFAEAGIASCVKHFPGHGDTQVDSHHGLPVITRTPREWEQLEAVPFRAAVTAGVPMIMTGHLRFTEFDDQPATFSHRLLTDLLRTEWGFTGVIATDSLLMTGARQGRSDDELIIDAFNAGVDLLLLPPSIPAAHQSLIRAVQDGRIDHGRLVASAARIAALTEKFQITELQ